MKFYKRKLFWTAIIIIILIIGGVSYAMIAGKSANKTTYTTEEVKIGKLSQTVSATGAVESAHEIEMNFKASGKITAINVKEGDDVKSGQILAKIDDATTQTSIKQARANLASAQASLARVRAGASAEDIRLSEQQYFNAKSTLDSLKIESQLQIDSLKDKNIDSLNNSAVLSKVALDRINTLMLDETLNRNLYFTDTGLLLSVRNSYGEILSKLKNNENLIVTAKIQKTDASINTASVSMKKFLAELNSFISSSYDLANSMITSSNYPQATKDSIKNDINSQGTIINNSLVSLQAADSSLTNSSSSFASQLKTAQNNIDIATAQLAVKKATARTFEIQSAQAVVAQNQATLEGALNDLKNYLITAPIDGKVVAVNYSVGELSNNGEPIIKILSNDKFEIKVDIPESDIAKVKVGDKAEIDLDAFGTDKKFKGTITFIDPAQTVLQDVVYYKTTVTFDDAGLESQIKPGMTANLTIATAEKENVLYVPQRAVKIKESTMDEQKNEKIVEILTGQDQVQERIVVTGLKGDDGLVEILSGISAGEKVVTFKKAGK